MSDEDEFIERYTRVALAKRSLRKIRSAISAMDDAHRKDVRDGLIAVALIAVCAAVAVVWFVFLA